MHEKELDSGSESEFSTTLVLADYVYRQKDALKLIWQFDFIQLHAHKSDTYQI